MSKVNQMIEEDLVEIQQETNLNEDVIHRNEKGGILITERQIRDAFDFLDFDKTGKITLDNIKSRLGLFYKNFTTRDYKFLLNNGAEMTFDDLKNLLMDNEIVDYDPVMEAFKTYDPEGTGYIDRNVLRQIFEGLGFGNLTEDDINVLIRTADEDKDGRISLDDFRSLIDKNA